MASSVTYYRREKKQLTTKKSRDTGDQIWVSFTKILKNEKGTYVNGHSVSICCRQAHNTDFQLRPSTVQKHSIDTTGTTLLAINSTYT